MQVFARLRRAAALSLFLCALAGTAFAQPQRRAILISWDGAADWVVDRLLAEGKLPHLARLAARGVRFEYSTPAYPSKTACGHAAIWTGAYGDINGITGNSVPVLPRDAHTLLEARSGFDSASLRAEPLYVTAAKAGRRVVVLSATQSFPPDRWVSEVKAARAPPNRFIAFSGFGSPIEAGRVLTGETLRPAAGWKPLPRSGGVPREFSFMVGDETFYALVYDDPADPARGMDTVLIRQGSKDASRGTTGATLKPFAASDHIRRWSPRFRVTKGDLTGFTYFRLFSLAPDGSMLLYQRAVNGLRSTLSKGDTERYLAAYGGFHDAPFGVYQAGQFGKTLWQGGDGAAEKRLMECIRLEMEFMKRGTRYALSTWWPDLLFHYTPVSDSAGHTWMGALDPDSPRYNPALAQKLWPFYTEVYQLQDAWLGDILDRLDKNTVLCLVSDHGMEGVGRRFFVNTALERAGLVARAADNRIDLTRTKVCAPPWADFFVCVNGTDWKGGIVPPSEREAVLRAATEALLSATDPTTGRRIVTQVFRVEGIVGLGIGGTAGGDLYLEFAPGYAPTNDLASSLAQESESPIGAGTHGFFPLRAKMQAICYMGGGGVLSGARLPGIRQIDIAPTLARLLGIPAPEDAQGQAINLLDPKRER